jgi:hypothetical protein
MSIFWASLASTGEFFSNRFIFHWHFFNLLDVFAKLSSLDCNAYIDFIFMTHFQQHLFWIEFESSTLTNLQEAQIFQKGNHRSCNHLSFMSCLEAHHTYQSFLPIVQAYFQHAQTFIFFELPLFLSQFLALSWICEFCFNSSCGTKILNL